MIPAQSPDIKPWLFKLLPGCPGGVGAFLFLPVFPFSSVVPVRRQSGLIVSSSFLFIIIIKECILKFYVFTFGCGGSGCCSQAFSWLQQVAATLWLWCLGFSLRWLLCCGTQALGIVAHGLSCPDACGIFPDQGSNSFVTFWTIKEVPGPTVKHKISYHTAI